MWKFWTNMKHKSIGESQETVKKIQAKSSKLYCLRTKCKKKKLLNKVSFHPKRKFLDFFEEYFSKISLMKSLIKKTSKEQSWKRSRVRNCLDFVQLSRFSYFSLKYLRKSFFRDFLCKFFFSKNFFSWNLWKATLLNRIFDHNNIKTIRKTSRFLKNIEKNT